MRRVLVAGMGNVLRGDDGFGVEVARQLMRAGAPDGVRVIEVGIGGVHLVQELMDGYDVLVIVDAVERGSAPGTVHLLEATVPNLADWPQAEREAFLADTHYATPAKALVLAKALDVLPRETYILGCQPVDATMIGIGLSEPVRRAAERAVREIERMTCGAAVAPVEQG